MVEVRQRHHDKCSMPSLLILILVEIISMTMVIGKALLQEKLKVAHSSELVKSRPSGIWFVYKTLRFSSHPGAKAGCYSPTGSARAQPCKVEQGLKAGFHWYRSHNQKHGTLWFSENSVLIHLILLMTLSLTIKWKLDCLGYKQKRRNLKQSQSMRMCIVIGLSFCLFFQCWQSGFH